MGDQKVSACESLGYEYETLMNMLGVSVSKHLLDEHFTLVWANDFYYDLIGYPRKEYEQVYHNQCDRYYINEELNHHDESVWGQIVSTVTQARQNGQSHYSCVSKMRRKDGSYTWVSLSGTFIDEFISGFQVCYTTMSDINDIMNMKLEQSITYDNLPGFIAKYRIESDFTFTLLDANERFFAFFGEDSWKNGAYPLYRRNIAFNAEVFEEHREAMLSGRPVHFTVRMWGQDGSDAWLQINGDCIDIKDGHPIYLVIYIDITNETILRQMQTKLESQTEQLHKALLLAEEANRAKSDFLSRMSHDIRTPMNAIIGMTDIAAAHMEDRHKVKDCLRKISLSSQHLLGLINDVLDMSKIENGKMTLNNDTMSLPETLENVVAIMQPQFKEKNQRFSIRLQHVIHEQLICDSLRLRQVILNILSNAHKFTPEDGSISMDVREDAMEDPELAMFTFTFADSGIGMKPEFLEHLFDAFSRERDSRVDKTEGTGLGMAITKKIVDLFGGFIEVFSQSGEGTTFRVRLPMKLDKAPLIEGTFPGLKILVADDDVVMCEYTTEMLKGLGVYADWAGSGVEAFEKIKEACLNGNCYDAVILDWKMPGLDGVQTTCRIRELCGDKLPILIISAYDWSSIENEAQTAGVSGFMTKPVFPSTLCRCLQKYVLGKNSPEEDLYRERRSDFTGKHLLLVEDNALNREVAMELLEDTGAQIDAACNGAEGVEAFSRSPVGFYDMVLMDIQMPVLDGYAATRQIRALERADARTVPILAMTADAFSEDISTAKTSGMNGHLAKPLDETTLKREIGKYL